LITSGITVIRYAQSQKIGMSNNIKIFWSNKTKGPTQNGKIRQRSLMNEGEEP
jgi:hypothetical protein